MNECYNEFSFEGIQERSWSSVFKSGTDLNAINLVDKLLKYEPKKRIEPLEALLHPFFEDLRL